MHLALDFARRILKGVIQKAELKYRNNVIPYGQDKTSKLVDKVRDVVEETKKEISKSSGLAKALSDLYHLQDMANQVENEVPCQTGGDAIVDLGLI